MSHIRLTCREASRLLLERENRELRRMERLTLRMHLAMCRMCTRFSGQIRLMNRAMSQWRNYRDGGP